MTLARPAAFLALALCACSQVANDTAPTTPPDTLPSNVPAEPSPAATPTRVAPSPTASAAVRTIGLEGLGDLRLGEPVPKASAWAERGAQAGDECRTVTSPAYPGVYGMVVGGKVRRITVGQRSDVTLVEGIGVGATEREVGKWFAGFDAEPHKYVAAPAKYLTAPNAESGDPALRFEIGADGKVAMIHVGMMPELAYVEGCS